MAFESCVCRCTSFILKDQREALLRDPAYERMMSICSAQVHHLAGHQLGPQCPGNVAVASIAGTQSDTRRQSWSIISKRVQVQHHAHVASASSAELAGAARNQASKSPSLSGRLMRGSQSSATTAAHGVEQALIVWVWGSRCQTVVMQQDHHPHCHAQAQSG